MRKKHPFLEFAGRVCRRLSIFFALFALFSWLLGQSDPRPSAIDSLRLDLAHHAPQSLDWAKTAVELGGAFVRRNGDSSIFWLGEGMAVFLAEENYEGIIRGAHLGVRHHIEADNDSKALGIAERRLSLAESHQDTVAIAWSYQDIGDCYLQMATYHKAQEAFLQSLRYFEEVGDSQMVASSANSLGHVFFDTHNYEEALVHYERAKDIFTQLDNQYEMARVKVNLANIYSDGLAQNDTALVFLRSALDYELGQGVTPGIVITYYNMGENYLDLDNLDSARVQYEKGLAYAEQFKDDYSLTTAYQGMGKYYNQANQPRKARPLLLESLRISEKMKSDIDIWYVLEDLIVTEKMMGNYKQALVYSDRFHTLTDSLRGERKQRQIQEISIRFEAEKKQKDLELAEEKEARATQTTQTIIIVSIVGGIMLLILVIFLFSASIRQRKLNLLLGKKNKVIKRKHTELESINDRLLELNEEKDVLMGIVAHDLKAPLTKASGLTQVLAISGELNEEQEKVIGLMNQVFRSGQKLIEELVLITTLENGENELVTESYNLVELVESTAESFRQTASRKSIDIEIIASEKEMPFSTHAEYLGRILDNLVSNAIKFSPSGTKIELKVTEAEKVHRVTVRDHGPGIPAKELPQLFGKFSRLSTRPTAGESSTGLGLYIVKELVVKLKGEISVESEVGNGTAFCLEFPR